MEEHKASIDSIMPKISSAYIYGHGTFAKYVERLFIQMDISLIGFIDYGVVPQDNQLILDPRSARLGSIVVLGFHNYQADIAQICRKLEKDGFRIINLVEFAKIARENGITVQNYWLSNQLEIYAENSLKIEHAFELFREEKSQDLFRNVIDYRKTGNLEFLKQKDQLSTQYFPRDLPWFGSITSKNTGLSVLDGGAFHGETFLQAREFLNISKWVFVEPDPRNLASLISETENTEESKLYLESALYSSRVEMNLDLNVNAHGSRISASGDHKINTITIDEIYRFGESQLDLIKLDVEGSELEALSGGLETIVKQKPFLAIAIYHNLQDHWEIPLFINHQFPFYDLYVRVHGEQTFDTVLYCVPK